MSGLNRDLALQSASSTSLRPSWDVPSSIFKSLELLQGLIKATSQDDVHPQAILAAEAMGAGFLVAPERLKDAMTALGANESYRLQQTRISVGLHYGDVQRAFQSSSSLLQFFVFCTAFRMIYIDEEIGDLLFEVMSTTGLITKHPVSPAQLARLINQVAPFSEQCVPTELMHEVACALAVYEPHSYVYTRMEHKALSELLVQVFENMRDTSALSLCLTGYESGVWIVTWLLWWFGDDACFEVDKKLLYGKIGSRLTIVLSPQEHIYWSLEVYRGTTDPTTFVVENTSGDDYELNKMELARIPLNSVRHFFGAYNYSHYDQKTCLLGQKVTAELATALTQVLIEEGAVYIPRSCQHNSPSLKSCTRTRLSSIAQPTWLNECNTLITKYGWDSAPDVSQLVIEMKLALNSIQKGSSTRGELLMQFCIKHIDSVSERMFRISIIDTAYIIAVDAILTSTTKSAIQTRYVRPPGPEFRIDYAGIVENLLGSGLSVGQFRALALKQLLTGLNQVEESSIILSSSGIVAGMSLLWSRNCDQREACAIRMLRGSIKYDGMTYLGIREPDVVHARQTHLLDYPRATFTSTHRDGKEFATLECPDPVYSCDLEMLMSVNGSYLSLKTYTVHKNHIVAQSRKSRVSWSNASGSLATAIHVTQATYPSLAEEYELGQTLKEVVGSIGARWVPPWELIYAEDNAGVIVQTAENDVIKMFAAASFDVDSDDGRCFPLIIHHKGSILTSLKRAVQEPNWVLLI